MALADRIRVARRFQRSIRIDSDLGDPAALDGFICPRSSAEVLETMARHVFESGQGRIHLDGPLWQWEVELGHRFECSA